MTKATVTIVGTATVTLPDADAALFRLLKQLEAAERGTEVRLQAFNPFTGRYVNVSLFR